MDVMQIGIVGVIGALLAIQFKGGKTEYGIFMSVAVSIFLFACIVDRLEIFLGTVEQIGSYIDMDAGYLSTMFKMIGVTYIAEFSSGIGRRRFLFCIAKGRTFSRRLFGKRKI